MPLTCLQCLPAQTSDRVHEIVVSARPATSSTCRIRKMELSHEGVKSFRYPRGPQPHGTSGTDTPQGVAGRCSAPRGFFARAVFALGATRNGNIRLATGGLRDGKSRRCPSPSLPPGPHYRERHPQVAHYIGLFSGIRRCSRQTLWQAVPWRSSLRVGAARNFHGGASHIAPNPTPRKGVTAIVLRIRLRRYCGISDKKNSGGGFSNARRVWRPVSFTPPLLV
jgi:hypothetical protein